MPWDRFAAGAALYERGSACETRGAVKSCPPLLLRRYGVSEPYEKLKAFTRGVAVTQESMQARPGVLGGNLTSPDVKCGHTGVHADAPWCLSLSFSRRYRVVRL